MVARLSVKSLGLLVVVLTRLWQELSKGRAGPPLQAPQGTLQAPQGTMDLPFGG